MGDSELLGWHHSEARPWGPTGAPGLLTHWKLIQLLVLRKNSWVGSLGALSQVSNLFSFLPAFFSTSLLHDLSKNFPLSMSHSTWTFWWPPLPTGRSLSSPPTSRPLTGRPWQLLGSLPPRPQSFSQIVTMPFVSRLQLSPLLSMIYLLFFAWLTPASSRSISNTSSSAHCHLPCRSRPFHHQTSPTIPTQHFSLTSLWSIISCS